MAENKEKKGFKFPSAFTILFLLIIVVVIATWVVPAGQYELNADGDPIPGSYHEVESNPQRIISDGLLAIVNGTFGIQAEDGSISIYNVGELYGAIDVAFFVLVIGGFLAITMETGAIDAGIYKITTGLKGKEKWMIAILMTVFAVGGTTYGMAEETLAFYGLIVAVMIAAGYDALVGVAVVMIGAGIGVLASTVNPFATGVASAFAGISIADGMVSRLFILVVGTLIGIIFVTRYAEKVRADPSKSLVYDKKDENEKHFLRDLQAETQPEFSGRRKAIMLLFALAFLIMIYSVIPWNDLGLGIPQLDWWFGEFAALFLFFAIVIGFVGRMGETAISETFVNGARDMLGVALIIGVARGVSVIMNNGLIVDTVLAWAEGLLNTMGGAVFVNITHLLYLPLGFLIPSSSGLATVTMPIMAPLADIASIDRSLVVTAYQSASGLLNLVNPTFAVVMGGLALGRVGYQKWLRFVAPLMLILFLLYALVLTAGVFFPGQIF
ncbi:MAG: YfcC family protein [candidate division Zixibacteria bacterium]|nr:YfcC family protein [candidate division Zixibacteria bacterium]